MQGCQKKQLNALKNVLVADIASSPNGLQLEAISAENGNYREAENGNNSLSRLQLLLCFYVWDSKRNLQSNNIKHH
jgi:hypothetical protein